MNKEEKKDENMKGKKERKMEMQKNERKTY